MTLQEAIEELDLALSLHQVVNVDVITINAFKIALGYRMNCIRYRAFFDGQGRTRFVMKPGDAEELRDLARRVIAEQVARKLTDAA